MKTFQDLLHFLDFNKSNFANISVNDLKLDSREIQKNDIFIAIQGHKMDGKSFVFQAIENGASAILLESDEKVPFFIEHVPVFPIKNLSTKISEIANFFYDSPSKKMNVIGVTGTNGKSTITHLVAQWSELLNQKSAVIGTIGNGALNSLKKSSNTTASPTEIQKLLADFVKENIKIVAIEVSSHALEQKRVSAINFSAVAFTNLTRDHLDYHKTMENYENAKWRLFSEFSNTKKIINIDDPIGKKWAEKLPDSLIISSISKPLLTNKKWLFTQHIQFHKKGATIEINSSFGNGKLESQLIGDFNVNNLLVALGIMLELGFNFDDLLKTTNQLKPVLGRMELLHFNNENPSVMIDYAHTPDALEKALFSVKNHCKGKIWCIFGCGGNRDVGKRPIMGKIAENLSDYVILTDDNPREEPSKNIIQDILSGLKNPNKVIIQADRNKAIHHALSNAHKDDMILIAGKGHETEQIIGLNAIYFSDHNAVFNFWNNKQ